MGKSKTFNIKHNPFLNEQYFHKKQNINNSTISNIPKKTIISNNEDVLNVKKDYSYKTYVSNSYKPQVAYVEHNLYKTSGNKAFNNTSNIHKHTDQYSTDVISSYKMHKHIL